MAYYFVKADLFGLAKGTVERFAPHKAGPLLVEGKLEPFDAKKHSKAPGAEHALALQAALKGE